MKFNSLLFLILALLFCFNCSGETTYVIEEIDGVKQVKNHASVWGENPGIRLEYVRTIGDLESENEDLMFYMPSDMHIDDSGRIYILDSGNYKVKVFDESLKLLYSFGSQGEGPGEFQYPSHFFIPGDGKVYVFDANMIDIFLTDGKFIETMTSPFRYSSIVTLTSNGEYLTTHMPYPFPGIEEKDKLVELIDKDGNAVFSVCDVVYRGEDFDKIGLNEMNASISPDNFLFISLKYRNMIEKYTMDGELLYRIERPLNYPVEDHREYSYQGRAITGSTAINRGFGFDSKGRTWMMTNKMQFEDGFQIPDFIYFHVFDSDGVFLGEVEHPPTEGVWARTLKIFGDRFFLIDRGDMSVIREFKIADSD
ncbi:6-bladed beta-propeller [candidate division KSB1 bacterium]